MAEKKRFRATIVISRHKRADLRTELRVRCPATNRFVCPPIPCGPGRDAVDLEILKLKNQLEKAGNLVDFFEE